MHKYAVSAVANPDSRTSCAEYLKSVVQDLPLGDFEPPNPVMQAIANAIGGNMAPAGQIKEISRADDGKFT
jgi:hypothetical protein